MNKVKVPSIQHAAGIWFPDPQKIAKHLLALANSAPPFSYENLYKLTYDLLSRGAPYEQIELAAQKMRHPLARRNYLEILPLLRVFESRAAIEFVSEIAPRSYPIGRDLRVLVNPPLIYFGGGQSFLPWFIFWKTNRFDEARLRLFVTMIREVFAQDPDIDDASLSLVICSEPIPKKGRGLQVLDTSSIASLSEGERNEMLAIFAKGYAMAVSAQAEGRSAGKELSDGDRDSSDDQPDLFA
ncbi:MAG: hypothetical protein EPN74_11180 [Rhodanobacter sp.]|nr:MAG: hypothetical protein EPN74_11180 [Rhodanobacter sp.]